MNTKQNMENPKLTKNYSWLSKIAIFAVALIITVAIIIRGNFLEGLLKLLGVGAAQIETVSISTAEQFRGVDGDMWAVIEGDHNRGVFADTAPFSYFTGQPADPGILSGFVMPLVAGGDPLVNITTSSSYTSPVVDLGTEATGNVLQSIEVLDYRPDLSEIIYSYRSGSTVEDLRDQAFQVLDMQTVETVAEYVRRQTIQGISVPRFMQFKVVFGEFERYDRPMVAEISIIHGPPGDVVILEKLITVDPQEFDGDFNGDGRVDSLDYAIFLTKFQRHTEEVET